MTELLEKQKMNIVIAGHVDHGKSTVIGRLLADTGSLPEGKLAQVQENCRRNSKPFEYAFLIDALKDEQSQGITIDTARVFFKTEKRNYIILDAPGHIEFLKNMVTGASTANLSVVLVDARLGVIEQTRRHSYLASLLGTPHLVFAINKMDLVGWSEERFIEIRDEIEAFLPRLGVIKDVQFIPMSALEGDNVVELSDKSPWYKGPSLLWHLETVHIASDWDLSAFRMPIQWVNRPNSPTDPALHDFRGLSGQISRGVVKTGQQVILLPSGIKTSIKEIWTYDGSVEEAFSPQSVTLCLADDLDASRGDMLIDLENLPGMGSELRAHVCWMNRRPLQKGKKYFLKQTTQTVQAMVTSLESRINMMTFEPEPAPNELLMNDIGEIRLRTSKPIIYDGYATNRLTGSFVLIEQGTNLTVAAGMLFPPLEPVKPEYNDFAI